MSAVRALREAIVARLTAGRLGFKEVRPHIGRYSIEDIKRLHRAAPAAAVGIVAASKPARRASGQLQIDVSFAAVIVTRASSTEEADNAAVDLAIATAGSLSDWVPAQAVRSCQPATDIHLEPVADDEIDKAGLVVWAVLWSHSLPVGTDAIGAEIDEAHRLPAKLSLTINGGAA